MGAGRQLECGWAGAQGSLEGRGQEKALDKISQTFRAEKGEGRGQEEAGSGAGVRSNVEANPEGVAAGPLLHS